MVRPRTSSMRFWAAAAGLCAGLCGSFAGAVVVTAARRKSEPPRPNDTEPETSQSLVVDQVDGPSPSDGYARFGDHRTSGKDYGYGGADDGNHPPYGPPRDHYYYDEPPSEHYRPHQAGGHRPSDGVYHQQLQHFGHHHDHYENHYAGGGEVRPNVQPLLWPLAGVALLGVLSVLVKTPLLLHLGHVRRRRNADVRPRTAGETTTALSDKFNDRRGLRRRFNPRACLVCDMVAGVYDRKSACVERAVCEVMSRNGPGGAETDKRLLTATIARAAAGNDEIADRFKERLESAATSGRNGGDCGTLYPCGGNGRDR